MTFCGEDRFHIVIPGNDRPPCRRRGTSVHAEACSNRGDRLLLGLGSHSMGLSLRGVQPRRLGLGTLVASYYWLSSHSKETWCKYLSVAGAGFIQSAK